MIDVSKANLSLLLVFNALLLLLLTAKFVEFLNQKMRLNTTSVLGLILSALCSCSASDKAHGGWLLLHEVAIHIALALVGPLVILG